MKKLTAILLTLTFLLSLGSCSESPGESTVETEKEGKKTEAKVESGEETPADETAPTITAGKKSFEITEGESVDFMEGVAVSDNSGEKCTLRVEGEYDLNQAGSYTLKYVAEDAAGNRAEEAFTLTVKAYELPFDENGKLADGTYKTKKGYTLEVKEGITYVEGYLLVNKSFSLPKAYKLGDRTLTAETQAAYNQLRSAASAAGHNLFIKSATRDWNDQNYIFNGYVANDGVEEAETYSARAGHSEHQSGMAMDLLVSGSTAAKDPAYAPTLAWLNENAYKYGFILRYPEGKTEETGYIFEAWHYRYVGVELAEKLYNNGNWITMEDYFGVDSMYRGYR